MPAVFIAGTDTDVGKTLVSSGLAAVFVRGSYKTALYKPVQTGSLHPLDLVTAATLAGEYSKGLTTASSYCFPVPATPWVSDLLANAGQGMIQLEAMVKTAQSMRDEADCLVVEGAGGIRVPITEHEDVLSLIQALHIPVLLVARPNLGTINHTRLTLDTLQNAQVPVLGVVVSGMPDKDELDTWPDKEAVENLETVFRSYLPVSNLVFLPRFGLRPGQAFSESDLDCFESLVSLITSYGP